jgi:hypothetical protein
VLFYLFYLSKRFFICPSPSNNFNFFHSCKDSLCRNLLTSEACTKVVFFLFGRSGDTVWKRGDSPLFSFSSSLSHSSTLSIRRWIRRGNERLHPIRRIRIW